MSDSEFISYAQNLEDVMLWRALRNVENGFYIDVGAYDPDFVSVTKAFYERGWHGINIEPMQQCFSRLEAKRPRDVNLNVAIGDKTAVLHYFEIPDSGSSTLDSAIASHYRELGLTVIEREVPTLTLSQVCKSCASNEVHFLKIDAEGMERAVLQGMDFTRYRPWIVVVEAICPISQKENHADWEFILLNHGYQPVYYDGINRFYLDDNKIELRPLFNTPPNYFDRYVKFSEFDLRTQNCALSQRVEIEQQSKAELQREKQFVEQLLANEQQEKQTLEQTLSGEQRMTDYLRKEKQAAEQQVALILASRSWRLTEPMRKLNKAAHRAAFLGITPRAVLGNAMRRAASFLFVRRLGALILRPTPKIRQRVQNIILKESPHSRMSGARLPSDNSFSEEAEAILLELKNRLASSRSSSARETIGTFSPPD